MSDHALHAHTRPIGGALCTRLMHACKVGLPQCVRQSTMQPVRMHTLDSTKAQGITMLAHRTAVAYSTSYVHRLKKGSVHTASGQPHPTVSSPHIVPPAHRFVRCTVSCPNACTSVDTNNPNHCKVKISSTSSQSSHVTSGAWICSMCNQKAQPVAQHCSRGTLRHNSTTCRQRSPSQQLMCICTLSRGKTRVHCGG